MSIKHHALLLLFALCGGVIGGLIMRIDRLTATQKILVQIIEEQNDEIAFRKEVCRAYR